MNDVQLISALFELRMTYPRLYLIGDKDGWQLDLADRSGNELFTTKGVNIFDVALEAKIWAEKQKAVLKAL